MLCTALISVDLSTHHPDLSSMLSCFLVPLCCLPEPPLVQQCALPWHLRHTSRLQVRESAEINWGCRCASGPSRAGDWFPRGGCGGDEGQCGCCVGGLGLRATASSRYPSLPPSRAQLRRPPPLSLASARKEGRRARARTGCAAPSWLRRPVARRGPRVRGRGRGSGACGGEVTTESPHGGAPIM